MHLDGWTLLLQAVNLAILVALLRWLFYRPLLAVIDARRAAIDAQQSEVAGALADARSQQQRVAEERAGLETSRATLLEAARAEAESVRQAGAEQARREVEAALADGRRQIDRERQAAAVALQEEAAALAVALSRRVLALVPLPHGDAAFVEALAGQVRQVSPAARAAWFAAGAPRRAVLVAAHPLDTTAADEARSLLAELLGPDLELRFEVDEALLAGAELRLPHGVVALSWSAELERARARMRPAADEVAS